MLYIHNDNGENLIKIKNLNQILGKMKSIKDSDVDYYLNVKKDSYCIVGIKSHDEFNCIIDLYNNKITPKEFFCWLNKVLSKYDDYYCVPNDKGAVIWKGLGMKDENLYLSFRLSKLIEEKIKRRYFKFLFINMLFELQIQKGLFRIRKKLYYKKNAPKKIRLDTF